MTKFYCKGIVRLEGKGRQGIGVELFRGDADVDLTESESDSIGEVNESVAVMRVYEEIGEDFFTGKGITAKKFAKELDGLGKSIKALNLHINCLGGDCFTAQTIHNIIKDYACERKTTYIDGVCASAATVIASAADEVVARNNSIYMVHLPWAVAIGNSAAMRRAADQLDTLTIPIVNVYKDQVKGRIREAKIRALMENETWMTAEEALDYGFVDKVKGRIKAMARAGDYLVCGDRMLNVAKYHYENIPNCPAAAQVDLIDASITKKEMPMVEITKEMIAKDYPDILAAIADEARKSERERLSALDEMRVDDSPELDQLIEAAKADGRKPSDIAMECFKLTKESLVNNQRMSALKRDGSFSLKAGDAPLNKIDDKRSRATQLIAKAFTENGERKK